MKKKAFKEILKYVRVIVFFAVITILVEAVNYVMVQRSGSFTWKGFN